jgi:hypothetical protein
MEQDREYLEGGEVMCSMSSGPCLHRCSSATASA